MKKLKLLITALLINCVGQSQTAFLTRDSITINNINAPFLVHGDMFWDPMSESSMTFFPKWTAHSNNFAGSIWMSGYDTAGNLHLSAQTYRQDGNDYWPGALDLSDTVNHTNSANWAKIWKVYRTTVDSFLSLSTHDSANTPLSILTWPGAGNNYATGATGPLTMYAGHTYAPFVDLNGDGIYEPLQGEYPQFPGDEALWMIFNDKGPTHNQSNGVPLGIETQLLVYAYSRGTLIDNVVYLSYRLINYSPNTYHNFRVTFWDDIDLGWYDDDFVGFDSTWRLGLNYNGTDCDGCTAGLPGNAYDRTPPISGITVVHVGFAPNYDTPTYQPVSCFDYFSSNILLVGNPTNDTEFNRIMRDSTTTGIHFSDDYSGAGHPSTGIDSGNNTNYVFPGDPSDPAQWSECSSDNAPGDRRFMISMGDFTIQPGAINDITYAFITTCPDSNNGCPGATFDSIKIYADTAWGNYVNPYIPTGIPTIAAAKTNLVLYPNPATNTVYLDAKYLNANATLMVYNTLGQQLPISINRTGTKWIMDVSTLPPGVYVAVYHTAGNSVTGTFVKE